MGRGATEQPEEGCVLSLQDSKLGTRDRTLGVWPAGSRSQSCCNAVGLGLKVSCSLTGHRGRVRWLLGPLRTGPGAWGAPHTWLLLSHPGRGLSCVRVFGVLGAPGETHSGRSGLWVGAGTPGH